MAYIVELKRKSGIKYKVVWYENKIQVSEVKDTRREANTFRKQKESEVNLGLSKKPSDTNFGEHSKMFMEYHASNLKPTTKRNYYQILKLLNDKFEKVKLVDMTPPVLNKYFLGLKIERKLKMNTIKKYRDVLKLILNGAYSDGIINSNPMDKLTFKFIEADKEVIDIKDRKDKQLKDMLKDLKILLDSFQMPYYKYFILIGYMTGMRKGEILALKWDCIDFDKRQIYIERNLTLDFDQDTKKSISSVMSTPKTKKSIRSIAMHDSIYYTLHEIKHNQEEIKRFYGKEYTDNNLVICKHNGEALNTMTVTKKFYEKNKIHGTNITPHKLRHIFASKMSSVDKKIVQDLLGHSTYLMTEHYQDYKDENENSLIAMNEVFKDEK